MAKANKTTRKKALPELGAFFVCEKTLQEADKVISVIRIVDTLTVPPKATSTGRPPEKGDIIGFPPLVLFLMLKSGDARGKRQVRLRLVNPSREREGAGAWQITFTKPSHGGHNMLMPLVLKWDKPGLYWFEVWVGDNRLGRTPVMVNVREPSVPEGNGAKPSGPPR